MNSTRPTWFERLTGFADETARIVRENITLDGASMTSRVNGRSMVCGHLEIPTLGQLRQQVEAIGVGAGEVRVRECVADAAGLHADPQNTGALFQVASQFNLLEMISHDRTPEDGVAIYEHDNTQGPACAIAAGAGTIYRNYFIPLNGQPGQSTETQIDCLADVGAVLGNVDERLWEMRNGYALATREGLREISDLLHGASDDVRDVIRRALRIGLQWDTEVTFRDAGHLVSQAYCSALPVAYSPLPSALWEPFARLVLEGAYEATLAAGVLNARRTGNRTVYLTLLGGGAFGNDMSWIISAVDRALGLFRSSNLDIAIVSYSCSNPGVKALVERWEKRG